MSNGLGGEFAGYSVACWDQFDGPAGSLPDPPASFPLTMVIGDVRLDAPPGEQAAG